MPVCRTARQEVLPWDLQRAIKDYVGTGYNGFNYLNDFYEFDPAYKYLEQERQISWVVHVMKRLHLAWEIRVMSEPVLTVVMRLRIFISMILPQIPGLISDSVETKDMVQLLLLYNNKAYLVTGVNSGVMQTDFWVFDPASDTAKWTQLKQYQ